jgi:hypothetical protein
MDPQLHFDSKTDAALALVRGLAKQCRYEDYTDTGQVWDVFNAVHMLLDNGRTIDQFFTDLERIRREANHA